VGNVVDGVESSIKGVGTGIADLTHDGLEQVRGATHAVLQGARDVVDYVEDTVEDVADGVGSAIGAVGSSVANLASNVSSYATLGVAAADHIISAIV
jgi:phage-related protein